MWHVCCAAQGLVCLMQLSTRSQDWLVDTLALRKSMGLMADLLADHTIVKVRQGNETGRYSLGPCNGRLDGTAGVPRRGERHQVAAAGLQPVRGEPLRHLPGRQEAAAARPLARLPARQVLPGQGRQGLPARRLEGPAAASRHDPVRAPSCPTGCLILTQPPHVLPLIAAPRAMPAPCVGQLCPRGHALPAVHLRPAEAGPAPGRGPHRHRRRHGRGQGLLLPAIQEGR